MNLRLSGHQMQSGTKGDITAIQPEVDELTDEDGVDDDALALPLVSDVAGAAEIFVQEEEKPSSPPDTPENPTKKIFLGILIFSGYHTLPSERDYWSDQEDLGVPLVRDAMSRNTYLEIKICNPFSK
ncbi:hypothetical protein J437_LFUL013876 [Ladona fulva]|uniref:PiggyBac transposable element-derived protein domain-containing protein n=1 Tax=Ladona fulva TaxID=123851 RepID=A0A8K0P5X1_LADFU|nr:hypothetical protein J437_LFUL013876 [Ladona fulva]